MNGFLLGIIGNLTSSLIESSGNFILKKWKASVGLLETQNDFFDRYAEALVNFKKDGASDDALYFLGNRSVVELIEARWYRAMQAEEYDRRMIGLQRHFLNTTTTAEVQAFLAKLTRAVMHGQTAADVLRLTVQMDTRTLVQEALDLVKDLREAFQLSHFMNGSPRFSPAGLHDKIFVLCELSDFAFIEQHVIPVLEKAGLRMHLDFRPINYENGAFLSQTILACRCTLVVLSKNTTPRLKFFIQTVISERSETEVAEKLLCLRLSGPLQFEDLPLLADLSDPAVLDKSLAAFLPRLLPEVPSALPTWPPLPSEHVDIGRLPQGGTYVRIFGRQEELALLDRIWAEGEKRLLCFHAHGGVGKSQLINRWLHDLGEDNFRGSARVLAWTFYSQGTGEKVSSADRFIQYALEWFGDPDPLLGSPWDKGKRLARLAGMQRTLVLLDGLEPLQYFDEQQRGKLKDPALEAFLRAFARQEQGLCIITSRLKLTGLDRVATALEQQNLETLSTEACSIILRERGATGDEAAFERVAESFGRHAFAMQLLASWLRGVPGHRVEAAENIPDLPDVPEAKGRHPRRVIAALYAQLLERGPADAARLLPVFGLFDRLVTEEVLALAADELTRPPDVYKAITELRDINFIYKKNDREPNVIDCHPLVREHFEGVSQMEKPAFWRRAHEKLYEYYRALPEKSLGKFLPSTLEEMEPLFLAITHGCRARLQQRVYDEVYFNRVRRKNDDYHVHQLGAFSSDLTLLSNFFEYLWDKPCQNLNERTQRLIIAWTAYAFQALGKFLNSVQLYQMCLPLEVLRKGWQGATRDSANLCSIFLSLGDISQSIHYGKLSIQYADQGHDWFEKVIARGSLAESLQYSGERELSKKLFQDAEQIQKVHQPWHRFLYSLEGFRYCDLLLYEGNYREVLERAKATLEQGKRFYYPFLIALDKISLGWACLLQWQMVENAISAVNPLESHWLNEAVDELRNTGHQIYLLRGLLARAAWHRCRRDYAAAREDLQEVLDIAEEGGMKLYLVDYHLETMRLLTTENNPTAAAEHREIARQLIEETGYKRRLPELEEGA